MKLSMEPYQLEKNASSSTRQVVEDFVIPDDLPHDSSNDNDDDDDDDDDDDVQQRFSAEGLMIVFHWKYWKFFSTSTISAFGTSLSSVPGASTLLLRT
jgi:hypothetical protein